MKPKSFIITLLLLAATTLATHAQAPASSLYFTEGYTHRSEFNAAFAPNQGYVSLPVISDTRISIDGNLALKDYLFPRNGELLTFLHPDVSASQFLSGLKNENTLNQDLTFNLIAAGWYTPKGGFWHFGISLKQSIDINAPTDLFRMAKLGSTGNETTYHMNNLAAHGEAIVETSIGHSREIILPGLRLGVNLKVLSGLGRIQVDYDHLEASMNQDKWEINADGKMIISQPGISTNITNGVIDLESFKFNSFNMAGYGVGIDLGATYSKLLPGLNLALAINDLGFMNWTPSVYGRAQGNVNFTGFSEMDKEASIEEQLKQLEADAKKMIEFHDQSAENTSAIRSLRTNIRLSGEYDIFQDRFKQKLYGGIAYYGRYAGVKAYNEFMVSLRYAPAYWFELSANYIQPFDRKPSLGIALALSPKGINFFIAAQIGSFAYAAAPYPIPIDRISANINFGIAIPIAPHRKDLK